MGGDRLQKDDDDFKVSETYVKVYDTVHGKVIALTIDCTEEFTRVSEKDVSHRIVWVWQQFG